ncbi:MAG: hypothetical protein OEV43_05150 [Coriobacteriia bacterium]|nr:hypothetical protein [Coriobacteriia bacterium]
MWNPFARKSESPREPQMSPFPMSPDGVYSALEPYMRDEKPMDFFFEFYIMEVVGALPPETAEALDEFVKENAEAFDTGDWRSEVHSGFGLSDTIGIAILDLWYRKSGPARQRVDEYYAQRFAIDFSAEYFSDDGEIDMWPEGELEAAKARIAAHTDTPGDPGLIT